MLKQHNKPTDAWSAFNGKVYNLTPYLKFHPGGEEEVMRCAGRDGTRLFSEFGPLSELRKNGLFIPWSFFLFLFLF